MQLILPIFWGYYIFNKTIKIDFVESGGIVSGIEFKPSLIEGKRLSQKEAYKVINVIQQLIDNANKPQMAVQDSVNTVAHLTQLYQRANDHCRRIWEQTAEIIKKFIGVKLAIAFRYLAV